MHDKNHAGLGIAGCGMISNIQMGILKKVYNRHFEARHE